MISYKVKDQKATREGFGEGLYQLGCENPNVVGLSADLANSVKMTKFMNNFPERFFQCGVAEANMMGVAAGLTIGGKIPFAGTFANFATGRVFDQVRQSIAYSGKNVKICASHAGLTLGEDGASHQILEDIGLTRMLPNMVVINPCDFNQAKAATLAISEYYGPVYLRFGRPKVPVFLPENQSFEIGKGIVLNEGTDVSIVATGHLVWESIEAAYELEKEGISCEIINMHTIKPLDEEIILDSAAKTGLVVTAEEHQRNGGLGEAVAQLFAKKRPTLMEMIAVDDRFGESGKPSNLLHKYGLDSLAIQSTIKNALHRKDDYSLKISTP